MSAIPFSILNVSNKSYLLLRLSRYTNLHRLSLCSYGSLRIVPVIRVALC